MREYRRKIVDAAQEGLFATEHDRRAAIDWWTASDGRRPVVLVGAGFSRNARWKATKARAVDLPMWSDVLKTLSADLKTRDSAYDAPTLADLHAMRFGSGHLRNALSALLPDDDLEPAEAHEALLSYDAEAIITTNHLDTLLDRNSPQWDRVVDDHDIAKFKPDADRCRQLIYFHGHRHDLDSWVVTRSQYEDIDLTRPIIVARVRQLLAQHPLLAVGYSLTDPDFHLFYRRISRDMRRRQPRGLALVIGEPDAAAEEYWRSLGIFVARLKWRGDRDYSAAFQKFFALSTPRVPPDRLQEIAAIEANLASRIEFMKEYFGDPARDRFVDSSSTRDEEVLWKTVESTLTSEAIRQAAERAASSSRPAAKTSNDSEDGVPSEEKHTGAPQLFPPDRFNHRSVRIRILEKVVEAERTWRGIAAWSKLAFETTSLRDAAAEHGLPELPVIVSWSWRQMAQIEPSDKEEAIRLMHVALAVARRYEMLEACKWIEDDLKAFGQAPHLVDAPSPETPFATAMRNAYASALEAEWSRATTSYTEALGHAASEASIFEKWLAASGRARAASRWRTRDSTGGPSTSDVAQYYSELKRLEEHPVVSSWMERARRYSDDIKNQELERNRAALRDREYDVRRFSFSNVPYFLWRWWRDLAAFWAPPWLQAGYLEPILQGESLERADKELKLRLQLEIKLTPDWLRDVVDSPEIQRDARLEVHASLCAAVKSICIEGSRTEKVGALAVLPTVVEAATLSDLKWIEAFLVETQHSLPGWVETPRGTSMPAAAEAACWRALVAIMPGHDAVSALEKAMGGLSPPGLQGLRRKFDRLPWYAWQLMGVAPERLATVILARVEETREGLEDYDVAAMSVAAAEVLANARTLQQEVPKIVLESFQTWLASVAAFPARPWSRPEVLGAAAYLWTEIERSNAGISRELVSQIMNRCAAQSSEGNGSDGEDPIYQLECRARVLSELLSCQSLENVPEEAARLLADLMARWPSIRGHCEANHGDVWPFSQFLLAEMKQGADSNTAWVREAVLDLMAITPVYLPTLTPVLNPNAWQERWGDVVAMFRVGGKRTARDSWSIAMVDILAKIGRGDLPTELDHLPDVALLATAESDAVLVNHAAYGLISWVEKSLDPRLGFTIDTLERLALDHRLAVRQASAYGAARLQRSGQHAVLRERMAALDKTFAEDPSARIQHQRVLGELEGLRSSAAP